MAATGAAKRKEPEHDVPAHVDAGKAPELEAKAVTDTEAEGAGVEAPTQGAQRAEEGNDTPAAEAAALCAAGGAASGQPVAKKMRAAPEPAVIRKQVEYYLSDDNLRHDKFFHDKIAGDSEGWLDMALVLSCNKMKSMRTTQDDVVAALADSKLELKDGGAAVRRPGNAPLPELAARPQHPQKKNAAQAHDGGAVVVFKNIPAEQGWTQVKLKLKEKLPEKVSPWHVTEVNDKHQCFVVCPPFEGDLALLGEMELELGGAKINGEICHGDLLQQTLRTLPKYVREKREKESRKRQKERNRPFVVGSQKFVNVGALRGKVKEILNSRSDGELLKPEGTDFKLIRALLEFHPKGHEKTKGIVGLKVNKSLHGDNRCFYIVRDDGSEEDVSMKKCVDAVETNPPHAEAEQKAKTETDDKNEDASADGKTPHANAAAATVVAVATTPDAGSIQDLSEAAAPAVSEVLDAPTAVAEAGEQVASA